MSGPEDVTIVLPVIDETWSLEETVNVLVEENRSSIKEIIIVTAQRTTQDSLDVISKLQGRYQELILLHLQTLPYLGGALRESFDLATGEFTVMMASDLETNPHIVKTLIDEIKGSDTDIVIASRWIQKGGFHNYGFVKTALNYLFQKTFAALYFVQISDMTYAFRIYRTDILKRVRWEELKHPFLFESLLKPLRLGYSVKEIPASWEARREGQSQNTVSSYFGYLKLGLKLRFCDRARLVREGVDVHA